MLHDALQFVGDQSERIAVISAVLSLAALTFSSVNFVRLFSAYSKLMRRLFVKERALNADLSDVNDRELRKIANYLSKFDGKVKTNPIDQVERSDTTSDFLVFCYAFEGLEKNYREEVLKSINKSKSQDKVRMLRNIIFHSHFNRNPLDFHFLVPSVGARGAAARGGKKLASVRCVNNDD
jgi:hypothetical protein